MKFVATVVVSVFLSLGLQPIIGPQIVKLFNQGATEGAKVLQGAVKATVEKVEAGKPELTSVKKDAGK